MSCVYVRKWSVADVRVTADAVDQVERGAEVIGPLPLAVGAPGEALGQVIDHASAP